MSRILLVVASLLLIGSAVCRNECKEPTITCENVKCITGTECKMKNCRPICVKIPDNCNCKTDPCTNHNCMFGNTCVPDLCTCSFTCAALPECHVNFDLICGQALAVACKKNCKQCCLNRNTCSPGPGYNHEDQSSCSNLGS